ncbi:MAG: DUF599 domain-containing protein [Caulobacteraceae bacterium]
MEWPNWIRIIPAWDAAALIAFIVCWVFYEPMVKAFSRKRGAINTNMTIIRAAWMREMAHREGRFLDSQLMGHALNAASFFASANLIVMAAALGPLVGGDRALRNVINLPLLADAPRALLEVKLALVALALGRGLLEFIWAIRQMNYCLALIGAAPRENSEPERLKAYGEAASAILNPALSSFNAGVRAYYFSIAAAAWLFGPVAFAAVLFGSVALLIWRQWASPTADAIRKVRELLD